MNNLKKSKTAAFAPLAGKVVVIVGGTAGLGLSASAACVAAGARVVVVGRDSDSTKDTVKQLYPNVQGIVGDASQPDTATHAIDTALQRFGGFHGLYHVAGGSGRKWGDGPLHEISDEGWEQTVQLNLTSLFYSNRAAVQRFLKGNNGGSVLNMGSVLGFSPTTKYFATHAYAATKAGIIGLTRSCAAYYAARKIRFNVIAPALVETPMAQRAAQDETIRRFIKTKQPLDGGRIGQPSDLDAAVVYFLSDASRFVTGQVLAVDGGWCVSDGQYPA